MRVPCRFLFKNFHRLLVKHGKQFSTRAKVCYQTNVCRGLRRQRDISTLKCIINQYYQPTRKISILSLMKYVRSMFIFYIVCPQCNSDTSIKVLILLDTPNKYSILHKKNPNSENIIFKSGKISNTSWIYIYQTV